MSTGSAFARVIGLTKSLSPFERKSDASGETTATIAATPPADPAGSEPGTRREDNLPAEAAPAGGIEPAPDAIPSEPPAAASPPGAHAPAGAEADAARLLTAADSAPGAATMPAGPIVADAGTQPGPASPTTEAALPWTPTGASPEAVQPNATAGDPAAEDLGGSAARLPFGPMLAADPTAYSAAAGLPADLIEAARAPEGVSHEPAEAVDQAPAPTSAADAPALAQVTLVAAEPSVEPAASDSGAPPPLEAAREPDSPVTGAARAGAGLHRTVTAEAINAIEADIASLLASLDAPRRPAEPIVDDGDEGLAGTPDDDVDAATLVLLSELDRLWRADPMVAAQPR
jgi:hypothetical protein